MCRACAVEVLDGLACDATCATKVRRMNELIEQNQRVHARTPGLHKNQARIGFAIGIAICLLGLVFITNLSIMLLFLVMGILFIVGSGLLFAYGHHLETQTTDPDRKG
jgi:hypothetical protein